MNTFYPTLVSDQFVNTVNFYEDHFDFMPDVEKDGYALLRHKYNSDNYIAVFDSTHDCVVDRVQPVQGLILSIAVENVSQVYDTLYMEGLSMYKDVGEDVHGRQHFVVYDPNGILVNVYEQEKVRELEVA